MIIIFKALRLAHDLLAFINFAIAPEKQRLEVKFYPLAS